MPPSPFPVKIDVLKALDNMPGLNNRELCWMEYGLAVGCGVVVNDQIRLKRSDDVYALYTVSAIHQELATPTHVRMGSAARQKLEAMDAVIGVDLFVGSNILRSDLSDEQAEAQSEFVERLDDNGFHTGLVALAPHGGGIEWWTDQQAEQVAAKLNSKGASSWRCKGWYQNGNAHDRWHIDASRISRHSFPLLDSIADRGFTYSVCFHGLSDDGILIGGLASDQIKLDIRDAIIGAIDDKSIDVIITGINDPHNGDSPANIVNWMTTNGAGGIQIEQSAIARSNYWLHIADAVASVFDPLI
jgi:phage replication-related protein YjqB (UPF0714/DUF867 family)